MKTGYIIVDKVTNEILCNNDSWEGFYLSEYTDNKCYCKFKLFTYKKLAKQKVKKLEQEFLKHDQYQQIDFVIYKVKVGVSKYFTIISGCIC